MDFPHALLTNYAGLLLNQCDSTKNGNFVDKCVAKHTVQ